MNELKFRDLRADEVDCRVAQCSAKGCQLLLYKDARVDQSVLDETVGAMNWQRRHSRDNANCIVSIWDSEKKMWVEKEDTGTESNTEAEKGLASDSFKRACTNWGIGRELYTAPFVWIKAEDVKICDGKNGKPTTYDKFSVTEMKVVDHKIAVLRIKNLTTKREVYAFGCSRNVDAEPVPAPQDAPKPMKQNIQYNPYEQKPAAPVTPTKTRVVNPITPKTPLPSDHAGRSIEQIYAEEGRDGLVAAYKGTQDINTRDAITAYMNEKKKENIA